MHLLNRAIKVCAFSCGDLWFGFKCCLRCRTSTIALQKVTMKICQQDFTFQSKNTGFPAITNTSADSCHILFSNSVTQPGLDRICILCALLFCSLSTPPSSLRTQRRRVLRLVKGDSALEVEHLLLFLKVSDLFFY